MISPSNLSFIKRVELFYEDASFSLFKNKNEEQLIIDALEKSRGNKSRAARLLSIDRKTLYNKLKQYGIKL